MQTRITPNTDTFYEVSSVRLSGTDFTPFLVAFKSIPTNTFSKYGVIIFKWKASVYGTVKPMNSGYLKFFFRY